MRRASVSVRRSGETEIRMSGRELQRMTRSARSANYSCPLKWFLSYAICKAQGMPMLPESRWNVTRGGRP